MEYVGLILGIVIGAVVAFVCIWFYRLGIKDGRGLSQGKTPAPFTKKKSKTVETDESKAVQKSIAEMFGYNPMEGNDGNNS